MKGPWGCILQYSAKRLRSEAPKLRMTGLLTCFKYLKSSKVSHCPGHFLQYHTQHISFTAAPKLCMTGLLTSFKALNMPWPLSSALPSCTPTYLLFLSTSGGLDLPDPHIRQGLHYPHPPLWISWAGNASPSRIPPSEAYIQIKQDLPLLKLAPEDLRLTLVGSGKQGPRTNKQTNAITILAEQSCVSFTVVDSDVISMCKFGSLVKHHNFGIRIKPLWITTSITAWAMDRGRVIVGVSPCLSHACMSQWPQCRRHLGLGKVNWSFPSQFNPSAGTKQASTQLPLTGSLTSSKAASHML